MNLNESGLISLLIGKISSEPLAYVLLLIGYVIVMAAGYLLGSLNSAIIVSRALYKDDIRKYGSGNAGLTNMHRTFGMKAAGFTLLGDMLKTVLAIVVAGLLFGFGYIRGASVCDACYIAALFTVLGHIFPVYYKFKGGKGVLVTATAVLVLAPIIFLILFLVFVLVVYLSKYVSLGSVSVAMLFPVALRGYFKVTFAGAPLPGLVALCSILLALLIVWCHRGNLERIMNQTERKLSFKKKAEKSADIEEDTGKETDKETDTDA